MVALAVSIKCASNSCFINAFKIIYSTYNKKILIQLNNIFFILIL